MYTLEDGSMVDSIPRNYTGVVYAANEINKRYLKDGEYHRVGGPAIIWKDGSCSYFFQGKKHRTEGPATIWVPPLLEYCVHNVYVTKHTKIILVCKVEA
jgi:hypothetical protein